MRAMGYPGRSVEGNRRPTADEDDRPPQYTTQDGSGSEDGRRAAGARGRVRPQRVDRAHAGRHGSRVGSATAVEERADDEMRPGTVAAPSLKRRPGWRVATR